MTLVSQVHSGESTLATEAVALVPHETVTLVSQVEHRPSTRMIGAVALVPHSKVPQADGGMRGFSSPEDGRCRLLLSLVCEPSCFRYRS